MGHSDSIAPQFQFVRANIIRPPLIIQDCRPGPAAAALLPGGYFCRSERVCAQARGQKKKEKTTACVHAAVLLGLVVEESWPGRSQDRKREPDRCDHPISLLEPAGGTLGKTWSTKEHEDP